MFGNIVKILRGTLAAQAVGFLSLPLLTRLFAPEAFGLFQLFQATIGLLLVTAAMRYEIALLRADDGRELSVTLQLCGIVNVATTLLVVLGCIVAEWGPWTLPSAIRSLLWWLPLGVLAGGVLQTLGYLALRHKAFSLVAGAKVAQALGSVIASIGIGLATPLAAGLVIGDLCGRIASTLVIGVRRKIFQASELRRWSSQELRAAARRFREYPLVSVPGGLINAAGGTLTSLMMFAAFDAGTAGQYALVERSLMLPVAMVAGAVSQVFTADLSAALRDGGERPIALFRGLVRRMLLLAIGPAVLVALLAPVVYELLFGAAWVEAGVFARVMSPLVVVALVTTPVNMVIMLAGYQKVQLAWEALRLLAMVVAWVGLTSAAVSPLWAVAVHVTVIVATSIVYLWLADLMLRRHAAT